MKRVFISFDYDHDLTIKNLLIGQSKNSNSPFNIADWSIKEHLEGDWEEQVKKKLMYVDVVCVLCGEYNPVGVNAEIKIAQEINKPYFLLKGYSDKSCKKPSAAKYHDKMYKWTWENLVLLVDGNR